VLCPLPSGGVVVVLEVVVVELVLGAGEEVLIDTPFAEPMRE